MTLKSRVVSMSVVLAVLLASFSAPASAATSLGLDNQNANYVRALYVDVLGRIVAPEEVGSWEGRLARGESRRSVVGGILLSSESLERIATDVYLEIAGSAPTEARLNAATALLASKKSVAELRILVLGLADVHSAMSTRDWIAKAYNVLALRPPSQADIDTRTRELASGTSHALVARRIEAQPGSRAREFDAIYQQLLHRSPMAREQQEYWGAGVFADLVYRTTILVGEEYVRRANSAAAACYIRALYRVVLGSQTPADADVAGWLDTYNRGASLEDLARGFVRSEQYQNAVIAAAFDKALHRAPRPAELVDYRTIMTDPTGNDHWSRSHLLTWLVISNDFIAAHRGDDWIRELHRIFLDRPASQSDIDRWARQLRQEGYVKTASAFAGDDAVLRHIADTTIQRYIGVNSSDEALAQWAVRLSQPPSDPRQNRELMAYAQQVGGQALVGMIVTYTLNQLTAGLFSGLLKALGIVNSEETAEALYRLARHPMHDLDMEVSLASSSAFYYRAVTDTVPPVTRASLAGTTGSNGWYRSGVSVALQATDTATGCCSGVAITQYRVGATAWQRYLVPFPLTADGSYQVGFLSQDGAGNIEQSRSVPVKIDATPPVISGAATSPPNAAGWYNTDVTVRFKATDATSGLARVTGDQVLSRDGAGQQVVGTAVDRAGNRAAATVSGINIDKTAPVVAIASPTVSVYANTADVRAAWTASDALSGIVGQSGTLDGTTIANGQPLDLLLLPPGGHTVSVSASDRAGNTGSASVVFTVTVRPDGLLAVVQRMRQLGWISKDGTAAGLSAKAEAAAASLARGNLTAAQQQLKAMGNEVRAQRGKSISDAAAALLLLDIDDAAAHLGS